MALFQFQNRAVAYQIDFAPIAHDLVLLQSSKFTTEFWRPVLDDFKDEGGGSGRVLTCDWPLKDADEKEEAAFFYRLLQTLGLHSVRVVAFGDASELLASVQRHFPGTFDRTLLFPQGGPKGDELTRAVREFCDF